MHYLLKALEKLPDFSGTCYRGFPSSDRDVILQKYKHRRPIQWGAFTSTTTDVEAARRFAGTDGVVIKMDVADGKDICPLSFFHSEKEIMFTPNHKFIPLHTRYAYIGSAYA